MADEIDTSADAGADTGVDTDSPTDVVESPGADATPADNQVPGDEGAEGGGSVTAPESFEAFDLPEGMELNTEALESVSPLLQEAGLNQDQAQKMVNWYAEQEQARAQAQYDSFKTMVDGWAEESKNDSEFGGEKFDESIATAKAAIDAFGTPELRELLESHGVGNHPEVIRFMVKVGGLTKEDNPGARGSNAPAQQSPEQNRLTALYPDN